ncbi:Gfo/Idh/MocA family protein [Actomonas aquatica]|uniref:Gfo/Idh/MocA family oxidoreductase n=1 Tax=Actomonas aquatica TaxID=2866162 RepID=A0ABZ1C8J5_9BACT|nr:Gfo/Idh/MocA family oxidoreductase [Opitutus sp. WL0086]WRQ88019.1 Gfo/Idh/MocA family oxidoreductase [Opitutus sp. WL0086]
MTALRIGFIGAGGNTKLRHLPGFAALPEVELVAVANRSVASAQAVAADFGIQRVETDWRAIVAAEDIDAVCIGTWPDTHAEMTTAALAAGKHVLVEARMARNVAEAETMIAAATAAPELVAQIVPSPFTLNFDAEIAHAVATGEIGELREVVVEHATAANLDPVAPLTWRQDARISGVNTLSLGICYEPLLRWLPGDGEVLAADAVTFTQERPGAKGELRSVDVPDAVAILGRWTGGARLAMQISSVEPGEGRLAYRLVGSNGTLHYDVLAGRAWVEYAVGGTLELPSAGLPEGGWQVEADFVSSVRNGTPVRLTDFATGRRYMQFTETARSAWQTK